MHAIGRSRTLPLGALFLALAACHGATDAQTMVVLDHDGASAPDVAVNETASSPDLRVTEVGPPDRPPAPDTAQVCEEIPACNSDGGTGCPGSFGYCAGGTCCNGFGDCHSCTCDRQCSGTRPFCQSGVCGECRSDADCPTDRPTARK